MSLEAPAITPEILKLIAEIDMFKGRWSALRILSPEALPRLRKTATIESVGSSTRIEGSHLSDKAVAILLSNLRIDRFGIGTRRKWPAIPPRWRWSSTDGIPSPRPKTTCASFTKFCFSIPARTNVIAANSKGIDAPQKEPPDDFHGQRARLLCAKFKFRHAQLSKSCLSP